MLNFFLIALYLVLSQTGVLLIKLGAEKTSVIFSDKTFLIHLNVYSLLGLAMYVGSFFLFVLVVSKYKLSFIMPIIVSIGFAANIVCAVLFLHEKITAMQLTGILVVLIGVVIINISVK